MAKPNSIEPEQQVKALAGLVDGNLPEGYQHWLFISAPGGQVHWSGNAPLDSIVTGMAEYLKDSLDKGKKVV